MNCPIADSCEFAGICESDDTSLIFDAILSSPEMAIMAPVLSEEELQTLAAPVVEAWNSDSCLREKVRALRGMQFDGDISHVSITMGISVTDKIDEILGVA